MNLLGKILKRLVQSDSKNQIIKIIGKRKKKKKHKKVKNKS